MNPDVISGLSESEIEALRELKRRVTCEYGEKVAQDEFYLRRFLRAREFDVSKAESMLRNNIVWRKKNKIDDILKEGVICEILEKYFPMSKLGTAKNDQLTRVFHFGNCDGRGILMSSKSSSVIRYLSQCFEEDVESLKQKSEEEGREIEKWNYILDFENITLAQATHKEGLEILLHLLRIYEANYPERLHAAYIINASLYFSLMFSLAKPLLSGATLQKVIILDKENYRECFGKHMSLDSLPKYLGGNKTDPDGNPRCNIFMNHGGVVPKTYYRSKIERSLATEKDCKKYTVQRQSKMQIKLEVDEPDSRIEWQFETQNHDIGFGIFFTKKDFNTNKPQELIPTQRVDTRFISETGLYRCDKSGIYYLVFDNTFSWFRQKDLYCKIYIITPAGEKSCVTN